MIRILNFTIPGEPKGKARPIVTKRGQAFTPKGTVLYENLVRTCFTEAYPDHVPHQGEVHAYIVARFPIPKSFSKKKREQALNEYIAPLKKPDADNITKCILDSLNGIAYVDDSHVSYVCIEKAYGEIPRVEVQLELIET
ncbi:RusA family crossover junction endodeoxyribonuclease [Pseudobutyrivibrio sp.]